MMRPRSTRRSSSRSGRAFALLAVAVIALLVIGSLIAVLPGDGGGSGDADDGVARVTPGAEIARLETAVASNPDDVDQLQVLAEVLANSGRVAESIPWFERAVAARPDDLDLRLAFGRALQRNGSDFDAELQFTRATEIDPSSQVAAFYLANLYESRARPDPVRAIEWYEHSVELAPDSVIADQARERIAVLRGAPASPTAGG